MTTKKKKENNESVMMSTIKQNINNCFYDSFSISIINDCVQRTNVIMFHVFAFINLYCCYLYTTNKPLPKLTKEFIELVSRVVSIKTETRGPKTKSKSNNVIDKLNKFKNEHYLPILKYYPTANSSKLAQIIKYQAISLEATIETNIKEHYIDHLVKLIKFTFGFDEQFKIHKNNKDLSNTERWDFYKSLDLKIKNITLDILNVIDDTLLSDKKYHLWIKKHKNKLIANKKIFKKDNIYYDLVCKPQDYLQCMFYINSQLELLSTNEKEIKLFHVLPTKLTLTPSYITIDTTILGSLLNFSIPSGDKELIKNKSLFWSLHSPTKKGWFNKKDYEFNYMIQTDGCACSILFKSNKQNNKKQCNYKYIEEQKDIKKILEDKIVAVIDPGKNTLITAMSSEIVNKKNIVYTYTKGHRQHVMRTKIYQKQMEENKTLRFVNGYTIKYIETLLSLCNFKTVNFEKLMKSYIRKSVINKMLINEYEKDEYRRTKWYRYINTQKAESEMIKEFKEKIGKPKETVIVFGDWSEKETAKNNEPTICKRTKKILKRAGYKIYLIDEYCTSKYCNKCEKVLENYFDEEGKLIWGLKCCKNMKCKPPKTESNIVRIHNRDINATMNMLKIVKELIKNNKRPEIFRRKINK